MTWLTPPDRLTAAQAAAIKAPTTVPVVLRGGPGAGKTVVLLHRAHHLRHALGPQAKVVVLVYTNVLRDFIRSAVTELRLDPESILTFDHWCRLRHQELVGPTPVGENGFPDFELIRKNVLSHLKRHRTSPSLAAVLVDEGQDLDNDCYSLLKLSGQHLTVAFDNKQALYHEAQKNDILLALGTRPIEIDLAATYRACPYVVNLACEFIDDAIEREQFRSQAATVQMERQTPLLYLAANDQDEQQRLVEILRERLQKNERVGILFPTVKQVGLFADFLRTQGILADRQTTTDRQGFRASLDFSSGRPAVLTYHSAKGLTFDSVLMPGVISSSVRASRSTVSRMFFVAITRATQWVYLSALETKAHEKVLAAMRKLETQRRGLVQNRSDLPKVPRPTNVPKPDDWTDI